jgi:hypothetical protein
MWQSIWFGWRSVYLIASYGRAGGRREKFPTLSGAIPTYHRGREVAKTKFVIKHLNLEQLKITVVVTCDFSHSKRLLYPVPHSFF